MMMVIMYLNLGVKGVHEHVQPLREDTKIRKQSTKSALSDRLISTKGGIQKTKTGKFASKKRNTLGPPPPPPVASFFATPKITPIFFVGKCIYNGQNKFYAWSHVKIFLFSSIIMVQFYHELTILHGVIQ